MEFQAPALDSLFAGRWLNVTADAFGWNRKWAAVRRSNSRFRYTWIRPSLDFRRKSSLLNRLTYKGTNMARRLELEQFIAGIKPSRRSALSDWPRKRRRINRSRAISGLSRRQETTRRCVQSASRGVSTICWHRLRPDKGAPGSTFVINPEKRASTRRIWPDYRAISEHRCHNHQPLSPFSARSPTTCTRPSHPALHPHDILILMHHSFQFRPISALRLKFADFPQEKRHRAQKSPDASPPSE